MKLNNEIVRAVSVRINFNEMNMHVIATHFRFEDGKYISLKLLLSILRSKNWNKISRNISIEP